jgi:hypothetical protein
MYFLKDCLYGQNYPICITEELLNLKHVMIASASNTAQEDVWAELMQPLEIL